MHALRTVNLKKNFRWSKSIWFPIQFCCFSDDFNVAMFAMAMSNWPIFWYGGIFDRIGIVNVCGASPMLLFESNSWMNLPKCSNPKPISWQSYFDSSSDVTVAVDFSGGTVGCTTLNVDPPADDDKFVSINVNFMLCSGSFSTCINRCRFRSFCG